MPRFMVELDKLIEYNETDEEKHFEMEGGDDHIIHTIRWLKQTISEYRSAIPMRLGTIRWNVIIPEMGDLMPFTGDLTIAAGEYDCNGFVELLRAHSDNPEAIEFLADMMEH